MATSLPTAVGAGRRRFVAQMDVIKGAEDLKGSDCSVGGVNRRQSNVVRRQSGGQVGVGRRRCRGGAALGARDGSHFKEVRLASVDVRQGVVIAAVQQ